MEQPLALKLRPAKLADVFGQEHLIGNGKILTNIVKNDVHISLILYGKPGIGKNSIAIALLNDLDVQYSLFNAAVDKKASLEKSIQEARFTKGSYYIIIDEIHRLNKNLQDILLPFIENGLVKIIALTTENPYFVINPAIRSRCTVLELEQLSEGQIFNGIKRLIHEEKIDINVSENDLRHLIKLSSGDFRSVLNNIELITKIYSNNIINTEIINNTITKVNMFSDSNGDGHYDLLSALQKSIRGSDVDASLYWTAKLIENGDFEALLRRLQIIAFEDIGMANPNAAYNVVKACDSFRQIGMPEGRIIIGHVVVHLATSPKSNTAHVALDRAIDAVRSGANYDVPSHLKDAHYASASKLGRGVDYKYPHDYPNNYVKQQYLPHDLDGAIFYEPGNNKYEMSIKNYMESLKSVSKKM